MNETEARLLTEAEKQRLRRILDTTPLAEMAAEVIAYRGQLIAGGFKNHQAFELTAQLHDYLCAAIFATE